MANKIQLIFILTFFLQNLSQSKLIPELPNFKDLEGYLKSEKNLWLVGTYMAAHKYLSTDYRYQLGVVTEEDRILYKKFPVPTLRSLNRDAVQACENSAMDCIAGLLPVVKKSGTMQHLLKYGAHNLEELLGNETLPLYAPFKNVREMFLFRQTAMYFLCWHTLRRDDYLKFTNPFVTCLEYLGFVHELSRFQRAEILAEGLMFDAYLFIPRVVLDLRDITKMHESDPFMCAKLWFCPDPCYGRKSRGNYTTTEPKEDTGNPCHYLPKGHCWIDMWGGNNNFKDLIKNRMNVSCDCKSYKKGFRWNNRFSICVDIDECHEKKFNCDSYKVCRNTVSSYICTCPRGFTENTETMKCEKTNVLHEGALMLKAKPLDLVDDTDLIDDIMGLFGFGAGSRITVSPVFQFAFTLLPALIFKTAV